MMNMYKKSVSLYLVTISVGRDPKASGVSTGSWRKDGCEHEQATRDHFAKMLLKFMMLLLIRKWSDQVTIVHIATFVLSHQVHKCDAIGPVNSILGQILIP